MYTSIRRFYEVNTFSKFAPCDFGTQRIFRVARLMGELWKCYERKRHGEFLD